MSGATIVPLLSDAGQLALLGARPRVRANGDFVTNAQGKLAIELPNGLVINSLLSGEEWKEMDAAIIQATQMRLVGVARLMQLGLTHDLLGLGTLVTQWSRIGEMSEAKVNMTGQHQPDEDRADHGIDGVPVPIIHKEFRLGTRELEASQRGSASLDTTNGQAAARVVAEKEEDILFNGYNLEFDGRTIYGYTNAPNRITGAATGDWGVIDNVISTVNAGLALAEAQRFYGPFDIYLNPIQYREGSTTYFSDGSGESPLTRLLNNSGGEINGFFRSDKLAAGSMVMVQMTSDVVDWAHVPAMDPTNLEWLSGDGMINFFKVLAVAVPRIKTPVGTGKTGIVHISGL